MEDEQELFVKIEKEFDNSGGGLSLSIKEFAEYFDIKDEAAEEIIQKLLASKRYQISEQIDSSSGKGIERLHIHSKYSQNYWLKSVLSLGEAQALLELGALLREPFDSRIKNLEIKNQHLVGLILQDQDLPTLPPIISSLTYLKILKLQRCKITSLPDTIGNLTQLKELDLETNKLLVLPETIGKLENLQELWCRHNQLTALPETLGSLKNLEILSLDYNQLSSVPEAISTLRSLKLFSVNSNSLTVLPKSLGNLTLLKKLELKKNKLAVIPETLGSLADLQILNLEKNQLSSLPESLFKLNNLLDLNISSNQMRQLSELIGELHNLQFLRVKNNQLSSLPKTLQKLRNLKVISSSGNLLNDKSWELLQRLDQSGVRISEKELMVPPISTRRLQVNNINVKVILVGVEEEDLGEKPSGWKKPAMYFRGAIAAIILFDKYDRWSFDRIPKWFDFINFQDKSLPLTLVGIIMEKNIVTSKEGENMAHELGMDYYEVSVSDEEAKSQILHEILKKRLNRTKMVNKNGEYLLKICILGSGRKYKDGTPQKLVNRFIGHDIYKFEKQPMQTERKE